MKIIAHRGFSGRYTENTLLAFSKAIEAGADGIETDLQLSLDDEIILFHDSNLKHLTGVDAKPEELTLRALKKLYVNKAESIPTLNELLCLTEGKLTLVLEVKYNPNTYKKLCEILVAKIENKLDWVEVSCFEDVVLAYVHTLNPDIKLHKLIEDSNILKDKKLEAKYDYASYFDINVALRDIVLESGLMKRKKVIFWTVAKENLSLEIEAGLYGIMTNDV